MPVNNKKKIFNDPVYGFINIRTELIYDVVEHPIFQRLRRIKQLGLTDFVYPGAHHTRFHHALGAMHLMGLTLDSLRTKGTEISDEEMEAALLAILLHDVGHGPFSHVLEHSLLNGVHHEEMSTILMQKLNGEFNGALSMAIAMFLDRYERRFFHNLISGQLDVDRLDYLNRDCFFTGVSEGIVGVERIIKMLDVRNDQIVVEEKGIYSIENFLNARRLMYWQVYLHKTTVSAEMMLIEIIKRARTLTLAGHRTAISEPLQFFLNNKSKGEAFAQSDECVNRFISLDDFDIWSAIKTWYLHPDPTLALLCRGLIERKLFKVLLENKKILPSRISGLRKKAAALYGVGESESKHLIISGEINNHGYSPDKKTINILKKDGRILDIAEASDLPNIKAIRKIVRKFYLCYPKNLSL